MSWQIGTFTSVDNMKGLRLSLGSYYKLFSSPEHQSNPVVSAPFVDYSGLGKCIQFYLLPNKVLTRMKTAKMKMMTEKMTMMTEKITMMTEKMTIMTEKVTMTTNVTLDQI